MQENFLPHMMTAWLRMHVSKGEAGKIKENLALLCTLKPPLLIIDPVGVALEYLELFHADQKMALLHIGDPEFKDQFNVEAKDAEVVIVLHTVLNLGKFHSGIDLNKARPAAVAASTTAAAGRESLDSEKSRTSTVNLSSTGTIYQVAPKLLDSQLNHVNPSQVISFELTKQDINRYRLPQIRR